MRGEVDFTHALLYCVVVGFLAGVLGSIPLVRDLCCLWIVLGGAAATYLASRQMNTLEPTEGAIFGGLTGLVYGIVVNIGTFILNVVLNVLGWGLLPRGVEGTGILSTLGIDLSGWGIVNGILEIVLNIVLGVVFAAVGGVLYAVVTRPEEKKRPAGYKTPHRRSGLGGR